MMGETGHVYPPVSNEVYKELLSFKKKLKDYKGEPWYANAKTFLACVGLFAIGFMI